MRPRYLIWLFGVFLLVAGSAQAVHPNCPTVTPDPPFKDFVFDLATGAPRGDVDYDLEDRVRFFFINRNPFLQYDIRVDTQELQEPALTSFTSLFSILSLLPSTTGSQAQQTQAAQNQVASMPRESFARPVGRPGPDPCVEDRKVAKNLMEKALEDLKDLQQKADFLQSKLNTVKTQLSQSVTIFESPTATCETLQAAGDSLDQTATNTDIPTALRDYQSAYATLFATTAASKTRFDEIDEALAEASSSCSQSLPEAIAEIAELRSTRNSFFSSTKRQELAQQKQLLETMARELDTKLNEIKRILRNPDNFITYRYAGPVENRSKSTVTVKIKKPADAQFPSTPAYTFAVTFGGPSRFALSVGIANSWLDSPEYEAIQGIPLDANGVPEANAMVTRVIGLKEDSDHRITPMLILNTRLLDTGVHFSFGLSGKVDNKGFDVEYLGGFSYSFGHNRAFVTVGAYNGRVQELQRGFRLGSKLPTEVATAPVRKDREWAPMIAISYRIR